MLSEDAANEVESFNRSENGLQNYTVEIVDRPVIENQGFDEQLYGPDHVRDNHKVNTSCLSPDLKTNSKSGVSLNWNNLTVNIKAKKASLFSKICNRGSSGESKVKTILNNVTGSAEPGTLLAIMGASGAGKSTLLNVLSQQNHSQLDITGEVLVNNRQQKIKSISAYVQQEELFIGTLTVREHLLFQALLRMPETYTRREKEQRVDDVIAQLSLGECQNTIIGVLGRIRGISGGEKKRLSFASEIITNPQLMFVDEPTSGLDSFMAENVVTCLHNIVDEGKTVIATIHQPSSAVFQLFDRLLLLSEGRTAYHGSREGAIDFFNKIGYPCPLNYNPADHYVHTLAILPDRVEECKINSEKICNSFDAIYQKIDRTVLESGTSLVEQNVSQATYKVGFFSQLRATLWRSWKSSQREPYISKLRMLQSFVIALIAGLVYFNSGRTDDQDMIRNVNGGIFFAIISLTFSSITGSLFVFPAELAVFLKEHKLGMYRTDVYFISKTLAELLWYFLAPALFTVVFYFMAGFRLEGFFVFFGITQLIVQCALSFGYLVSTISPSVQVATSIGPALMMPFLLFGGFFLKDKSIPVYFVWLKWLSWFKYASECLQVNQWDAYGKIGGCSNGTVCFSNGKQVLKSFDYSADNMLLNICLLILLMVVYRLLAFFFVLLRGFRAK